jgi:hypothetical protein
MVIECFVLQFKTLKTAPKHTNKSTVIQSFSQFVQFIHKIYLNYNARLFVMPAVKLIQLTKYMGLAGNALSGNIPDIPANPF